jgi:hypothetical protein
LYLQRGRKTRSLQKETILRCYACRKDGNRNYVKPALAICIIAVLSSVNDTTASSPSSALH